MSLMIFEKCWRGRTDCESFHAIDAPPDNITEQQWAERDYTPKSFFCVGCINDDARSIEQDAYRICFKSAHVDQMSDNDEQDLTHLMATTSHALAIIATRRVNSGMISVPTKQGNHPSDQ